MVSFYGDYNLTETINIPFNTFSSDDPSASVTVTNLAGGDVYVHKDGAEGTPTGITVSLNVGSVNGNHLAILDLSNTNDAGFYAVGSRYQVRMEGVTIDGAQVNAWIGAFSIGCTLRPTTVGRTLTVSANGEGNANVVKWVGTAPVALSSQRVQVDVQAIEGFTAASMVLGWWLAEGLVPIADSGTTTTLTDATLTQADDYWNGSLLVFRSGTNTGRTAIITDFDAGTDTLTFAPAVPDAVTTEGYILIPGLGHADIAAISHDPDAADKLEAQFDGRGLVGDTYPLRQDQGASISGGLAVRTAPVSVGVVFGTSNDFGNMGAANDNRWTGDDNGSGADFIFRYTPADASALPGELSFEGYYSDPPGAPAPNGATLSAYDFGGAVWVSLETFTNGSSDVIHDIPLVHEYSAPGSGNQNGVNYTHGDVLIRFAQDTTETGAAVLLIDLMTVGFISSPVTAAEIVNEWESQSQADPTGFHVNVLEIAGTNQTANDNGADINAILTDTGTTLPGTLATLATTSDLGTVYADVQAILVDTGSSLPTTLSALATATNLAAVKTVVDAIDTLSKAAGDGDLAAIKAAAERLTAVRAAVLTDWINGGRLDLILDSIASGGATISIVTKDEVITVR